MRRAETKPRIVGIDWLELFVAEDSRRDYSPDGFRERGWLVLERDYGTMTMEQMFTLFDTMGHPFVEVRRAPRGLDKPHGKMVYSLGDSYLKLSNMYCYDAHPVQLMQEFCEREGYTLKKIYRIDLYTDFEVFDSGDKPKNVVRRIANHTYAKINQATRRTHGEDRWTECTDNWISWGAPKSMVSTKIYDKSLELRESKHAKPWILENWRRNGYIDDVTTISRGGEYVQMWRIEFSIKGSAKRWIYISKKESQTGQAEYVEHSLLAYSSPLGIVNAIANLIPYYFRFKIYEEGKRKSLCKDKVLFIFSKEEYESGYRLTSESDCGRVRAVDTEDDTIALNHLSRAWVKLSGTKFDRPLVDMMKELRLMIDRKCQAQYGTSSDVPCLW